MYIIVGKVKDFIEKKRKEGLDDETIDKLVQEKFNIGSTGTAFVFGTGKVYNSRKQQPPYQIFKILSLILLPFHISDIVLISDSYPICFSIDIPIG